MRDLSPKLSLDESRKVLIGKQVMYTKMLVLTHLTYKYVIMIGFCPFCLICALRDTDHNRPALFITKLGHRANSYLILKNSYMIYFEILNY